MSYKLAITALTVSLAAIACDKDKGDEEETGSTTQGVVSDEQPEGDGDGGAGGDDGVPDCEADCKPKADPTTQSECVARGDFWYDESDVDQSDVEGFESLKPSCHDSVDINCPSSGMVPFARSENGGGTLVSADVEDVYIYESYNDLTAVYSTLRCFSADGGIELSLSGNPFTKLDLSVSTNILSVDVSWSSDLASIVFPKNVILYDQLDIASTMINPADLPAFPELTELEAGGLAITALDLSGMPNLERLEVNETNLTTLDLSHTPNLYHLDISGSMIDVASLDLASSGVTDLMARDLGLTDLSAVPNTLFGLDVSGNTFGTLDLSAFTSLYSFACYDCNLTAVTFAPGSGLIALSLWYNQLASIDLSGLADLRYLDLSDNLLTSINLTANTLVSSLDLANNDLTYDGVSTKLDLSTLAELDWLVLRGNDNFVLAFESGVTFHDGFLTRDYPYLAIESAKWDASLGPDKPAWFAHGSDPYTYYDATPD